jgi:hypothetical protein
MFSFSLFSVLVFTGIGRSSAQLVSLCVCVCFIPISFLFGLVCNKRSVWCYFVVVLLRSESLFSMFSFSLFSVLVFTGIGHSSAQLVSLCVCVCICFISISFLFGLVCNKRREGYDAILLLFCRSPNLHFLCSLFLFFLFLSLPGLAILLRSEYVCLFVCCISISFLFDLVFNKRREGHDVILLLFC